ncbi:hypothetical protein Pyn_11899 [Prunus yedoensis var. nudiflora]|uniref:Uncharacterized protein n=1 Tax=Prunus yedoensis var. nudiflora TaxID=2094558 RepID=A0A314Y7P2_PRUYE|nr:hypothetical protein Pyn_11899 [Prunus yedoensis var. nudiflora]
MDAGTNMKCVDEVEEEEYSDVCDTEFRVSHIRSASNVLYQKCQASLLFSLMEIEKRLNIMDPDALIGFSAARMLCCLRCDSKDIYNLCHGRDSQRSSTRKCMQRCYQHAASHNPKTIKGKRFLLSVKATKYHQTPVLFKTTRGHARTIMMHIV